MDWGGLAAFGAVVAVAALVGGLAASGAASTYQALDRPGWAPPSWLFGPVWTVLYALIAIAGWLVWRRHKLVAAHPAMIAYAAQLVLNALWTPIFFAAGRYGLALVDILALWITIGVTIALFWRRSAMAALLLVPYWAWVTFAAALNAAIWRAN